MLVESTLWYIGGFNGSSLTVGIAWYSFTIGRIGCTIIIYSKAYALIRCWFIRRTFLGSISKSIYMVLTNGLALNRGLPSFSHTFICNTI